jgi:tetratricopeptide (TPR) repeat protein
VVKAFGAWRFARGSLAFEAGDLKAAVKELELAVQREPLVPEFRANLRLVLLEKGKAGDHFALRRARQLLEEACREEPQPAQTHTQLGIAKLVAGDAQGALGCFDRALKLEPNHVPSLINRGAALKQLGRLEEALAMAEKLLKLDPSSQAMRDARAALLAALKG